MRDRSALWPLAKFVAVAATIAGGAMLTPAWLFDIPFVWVVPVLAPAGFVLLVVDVAEGLWIHRRGPQSPEEQFQAFGAMMLPVMLGVIILTPLASIYDTVREWLPLSQKA